MKREGRGGGWQKEKKRRKKKKKKKITLFRFTVNIHEKESMRLRDASANNGNVLDSRYLCVTVIKRRMGEGYGALMVP